MFIVIDECAEIEEDEQASSLQRKLISIFFKKKLSRLQVKM